MISDFWPCVQESAAWLRRIPRYELRLGPQQGAFVTCQAARAASPVGLATNAAPATAALAITHGPFLQAPSETGVTLSWATSRKCVSKVEYRPESSTGWLTNIPTRHGLVEADATVHNVTLAGLQPGTPYRYRVVSREIAE